MQSLAINKNDPNYKKNVDYLYYNNGQYGKYYEFLNTNLNFKIGNF